MSELLFTYKGKELIRPLSDLLALHVADIAAVDERIGQHSRADIEAAKAPPRLTGTKQTAGELEIRRLLATKTDLLVKKRETELWLFEARRTPRARWQLDMRDLAALYPLRESA